MSKADRSIQKDLSSLAERDRSQRKTTVNRVARAAQPATTGIGDDQGIAAGGTSSGSGLTSPLTMQVLSTTVVSIPVPAGVDSVDVEVVQSYRLTDSEGVVLDVIVVGYP